MTAFSEQEQMVTDCENREDRLTDWQRNFIDSLRNRMDSGKDLTPRQLEVLEDVWEKVTQKG